MSLFKEYVCGQKFNQQTFQLNLSNLVEDEGWQFQCVRMKILIVFFQNLALVVSILNLINEHSLVN